MHDPSPGMTSTKVSDIVLSPQSGGGGGKNAPWKTTARTKGVKSKYGDINKYRGEREGGHWGTEPMSGPGEGDGDG